MQRYPVIDASPLEMGQEKVLTCINWKHATSFNYFNNALKAEKEVPGTLTKANKRNAKAGRIISIVAGVVWVAIIALVILLGIAWNK